MIFVAHDIMYLVHVDEIDLAESLKSWLTSKAKLALIKQKDLDVVETPWDELPWQTLICAFADLLHEAVM